MLSQRQLIILHPLKSKTSLISSNLPSNVLDAVNTIAEEKRQELEALAQMVTKVMKIMKVQEKNETISERKRAEQALGNTGLSEE